MNVLVRGVSYYVEVVGEGEPLLLLHGFTGSVQTWYPFLSEWKERKLVMIDIIGHGKTDSPDDIDRYTIESVAIDLYELLKQLGIEKVDVLGYSMGGRLALTFAIRYPQCVRMLILESSSPGLKTEEERNIRRKSDEVLAIMIEQYGVAAFVEKWEQLPLFATQKQLPFEQQENIRRERLSHSAKGLANSLRGMGTGNQPSWWEHLTSLSIPTLLLCGEWDEKFCQIALEMKERLPNAKLLKISHAGHAIHVEQPKIFAKIVNEFIEKGGKENGD
ncbi:2-succinyl-6-hydroxy-2,4-cyclohexadiene-1-carboxylate synthase [Anoxybacteroides amylolyticum]|uniref:Putative 2-succinyl-6-hydroxy-2,4-cyclohexadiene-1-carboxylate synthase n=1 Tax=Anoxybacteroides amylolyticum TaxID=294699 RepID=A0A160F6G1_9BACL|nr:2-succinyl-6-hydroxy-2,4-cyclohexadiene-1-carboxylate synthase [Anoxybacillus amylolyticus]ANB62106.1 2-succinyl-6-hydroxy-2,4-cyclohexadiene-1-carboxylate synthase [Anoxybacillus amylolyticus]